MDFHRRWESASDTRVFREVKPRVGEELDWIVKREAWLSKDLEATWGITVDSTPLQVPST